jgi:tRNA pseudouridine38-40 synthase
LRYFLHIAFNGNTFRGWQKLPGIISVQQVIETTISQVLKVPTTIVGCGRTDAQVHASQFFFHFDSDSELDFDLLFRLNKCLPHEIVVYHVILMEGLPHARFDAIRRSYDYYIHIRKDPYLTGLSAYYPMHEPDLVKMKEAVGLLTQYNDYGCFCKSPLKYEHTICRVTESQLFTNTERTRIRFHITSNRFLAGMIRIVMGKLLEIGAGVLSVYDFEQYLIRRETPKTIIPVYAQGLYLSKVTYPYLDLPQMSVFGNILLREVDLPV